LINDCVIDTCLSPDRGPPAFLLAICDSKGLQCRRFPNLIGTVNMARRKKTNYWTPAHVKMLRKLSGKKSAKAIGRALKRSESAVRFKAWSERISLAMK
jgi:hypothetical protein